MILFCVVQEEAKKVGHVSKVLYHWRVHRSSTSDNPMSKKYAYDAGQRAIEEHLKRMGQQGTVSQRKFFGFYRVKYQVQGKSVDFHSDSQQRPGRNIETLYCVC